MHAHEAAEDYVEGVKASLRTLKARLNLSFLDLVFLNLNLLCMRCQEAGREIIGREHRHG